MIPLYKWRNGIWELDARDRRTEVYDTKYSIRALTESFINRIRNGDKKDKQELVKTGEPKRF